MKVENRRTLCSYYNEIVYKVNQLTEMCGNTDEAIKLRDDIYDMLTVKFSEPLDDIAYLQEELGCPLEVLIKAKQGFFTKKGFISPEHIYTIDLLNETIDFEYLQDDGFWNEEGQVYIKDYKKTWWLNEDKSE